MSIDSAPFLCLLLAAGLIYLPRLVVIDAQRRAPGGLDNAYPRLQQSRLEGLGARAQGAHANSFEAFAAFAAGVLASRVAGVDPVLLATVSALHVAARLLYIGMYLGDLPTLRTAVWGVGFVCTGVLLTLPLVPAALAGPIGADDPIQCDLCDDWNQPRAPFRVFGNTWYVGVDGLSAVLIAGDEGLVLLDGGLPQSAPSIAANLRTAGFDVADVAVIAVSHAHFDHVGGVAALARDSGAEVVASALGAAALRAGRPNPEDPQYGFGRSSRFPAVHGVRVVADGEVVKVGDVALTARYTPGHTPGGTTWTWRSCEGDRCLNLVYADSLNAVSSPRYRFSDHPLVVAALRTSVAAIASLPCDLLLSVHPDQSALFERAAGEKLVDRGACRVYAATAEGRLEGRLADERR